MNIVEKITEKFAVTGEYLTSTPYGSGHINDTYKVTTVDEGQEYNYILQKINTKVFRNPEGLMQNYAGVTEYLSGVISANGGNPLREALSLVKTLDGKDFYVSDNGEYYRMLVFVENSMSYDKVETPKQFYDSALAFGKFQNMLRDYPAERLFETIPDFHNTEARYKALMDAYIEDRVNRASEVSSEIEFAKSRCALASTFENARREGRLPLRVTHNDTKLNNILFDKDTGEALCVVDLDTIMPGYAINDFGDSIRFGATTALEDEVDLSKVNFDIELYEIYVKGFLLGSRGGLSDSELELMPYAAIMMTFECGMRFLTDYLSGDTYFKISRTKHNLDRARNQFKLVSDMEANFDKMCEIVKKYSHK